MKTCQLLQAFVSFSRQLNLHPAPVTATDAPPDQRGRLASGNQRHNPVMLRLQAFGKFSYRCPFSAGEALDLEHQQILQRRYSFPARYLFAKAEIATQLVAELSEPFKIALGHVVVGPFGSLLFHDQPISHCDTITQARS